MSRTTGASPSTNKLARAGASLLKRLVMDEDSLTPENRRDDDRTPVAGEVTVTVLNEAGASVGQTRVFIRDISKTGCGLWSRVRIPAGVNVLILFPATGSSPPLQRPGLVTHCRGQDKSGFALGVRFRQTPPEVA